MERELISLLLVMVSPKHQQSFKFFDKQRRKLKPELSFLHHAASNGYKNVPFKSPDYDLLFILLHFVNAAPINILLESKIKSKASLINVTMTAGNLD